MVTEIHVKRPKADNVNAADGPGPASEAPTAAPTVDMARSNFNLDFAAGTVSFAPQFELPRIVIVGDQAPLPHDWVKGEKATPKDAPKGEKQGTGTVEPSKDLFPSTHTANKDGGYTEEHHGPRKEDNYVLTKTGDGKYLVADQPGGRQTELDVYNTADLRVQRAMLRDLADQQIKDPTERAAFAANMTKFENRSAQLEDIYKREGMSHADAALLARAEIAKTYDRISFVLDDTGRPGSPIHEKERGMIAAQILNHAATPTSIDQGQHLTCNVTTIESRTYTRHPSQAAEVVANVAVTGKYTAKDGTRVTIGWDSLVPDKEAENPHPPDGSRDLASQIFQVTAPNIWYQKHDPSVHYEQTKDGERLYKYAADGKKTEVTESVGLWGWITGKEGKPTRSPDLIDAALVEVGNAITGGNAKDWFFEHTGSSGENTVHIDSVQDLEFQLAMAKARGTMPIVIAVHTGNEPFYTDSDHGTAGGSGGEQGGWHVVNVTDYHPGKNGAPSTVAIDNQWGSWNDHFGKNEIPTRQLYLSMRPPTNEDQLAEAREFVRQDKLQGKATINEQLEMLRLDKQAGNVTDQDFNRQLVGFIQRSAMQYGQDEKNGKVDSAELDARLKKMMDTVNLLPADKRMNMIVFIQKEYSEQGKKAFSGNAFLGEWGAKAYCAGRDEYRAAQHDGSLDNEKMDRFGRMMNAYDLLVKRVPPAVADSMHQILVPKK